jgi:hypothetical protein
VHRHTKKKVFHSYLVCRYNQTTDLAIEEQLARQSFERNHTTKPSACANTSKTPIALGTASAGNNCSEQHKFVFNVSGREGCLAGGMGGRGAMSCYTAVRKPSFSRKPNPSIRCSRCGQWISSLDTLRITAEERIEAGSFVRFEFSRIQIELMPPKFGLAKDSPTIQVVHSNDSRQVPERSKFRSVCSIPAIISTEAAVQGCVRGSDASTFTSPDGRVTIASDAVTSSKSAVVDLQLAAFDHDKTAITADQQVVGPVVKLWFEPGVEWHGDLNVGVPISGAALVGAATHDSGNMHANAHVLLYVL